jgi:hypothetical protein
LAVAFVHDAPIRLIIHVWIIDVLRIRTKIQYGGVEKIQGKRVPSFRTLKSYLSLVRPRSPRETAVEGC